MGNTTPTVDLPRSKVRVIKPNPETGEIIERVIPHKDFRPKLPTKPKVDERRITVVHRGTSSGPTGRSVVYMSSVREREIDYWQAFDHILTPEERRHLAADNDSNSILRPIEPAWGVGDRMYVAANMEAEVIELPDSPRGHATVFKIHDYRVLYLKRGVLGDDTPKVDEHGYAAPLTEAEKERASRNSAYTTNPAQAINEGEELAAPVLDPEVYQRIHADQAAANAVKQSKGRVQVTRGRLLRRIEEAKAKNRKGMVRYLERQLDRLDEKKGEGGVRPLHCDVYWGSHGCDLERGHRGSHRCSCADDPDIDPVTKEYRSEPGVFNVGAPPYYGPETRFYGDDVFEGQPVVSL